MIRYHVSTKVPNDRFDEVRDAIMKSGYDFFSSSRDEIMRHYELEVCVRGSKGRARMLGLFDDLKLRTWCMPE